MVLSEGYYGGNVCTKLVENEYVKGAKIVLQWELRGMNGYL